MPIRMGGLQSGMDTESIIKMMLDAEMQPVKRQKEKITDLQDDVYGWNTIDSALTELGGLSNELSSFTTWSQKTTTTTDETRITATAERSAVAGSYSIEVSQLAAAHSVRATSIDQITTGDLAAINDPDDELDASSVGDRFSINGSEIEIEEGDTLRDLALKINIASASLTNPSSPGFKAMIVDKTLILQSEDEGIGNGLALKDINGSFLNDIGILSSDFEINPVFEKVAVPGSQAHEVTSSSVADTSALLNFDGVFNIDDGEGNAFDVTVDSSMSLDDIRQAIQDASDTASSDVAATIVDNKLVITGDTSGNNSMTFKNVSGDNILEELNIITSKHINNGNVVKSDGVSTQYKVNSSSIIALGYDDMKTDLNKSGKFVVNDGSATGNLFSVEVTNGMTLEDVKDLINTNATAASSEVVASIEDNKLVLKSTSSGFNQNISLADTEGTFLEDLNILSGINTAHENDPKNLEATINGIEVTATKNEGVSSLIDGVNINFAGETIPGNPITFTVKNETENIKSKLKEFIDKYNEVMDTAETLGSVKLNDTGELTAAGLLQGEFLITEIQSNARTMLTQVNKQFLGDDLNSLDDVGVYTYGKENRLKIVDEDKLDDALENHFDDMKELFRGIKYDDDGKAVYKGVMRSLDDYITNLIKPLTGRISIKTDTIQDDIAYRQSLVDKKTADLKKYENYLWEHFANMETSMASIQNGGAYMLQTLGMANK